MLSSGDHQPGGRQPGRRPPEGYRQKAVTRKLSPEGYRQKDIARTAVARMATTRKATTRSLPGLVSRKSFITREILLGWEMVTEVSHQGEAPGNPLKTYHLVDRSIKGRRSDRKVKKVLERDHKVNGALNLRELIVFSRVK
ncbi:hypothetical protein R1sor_022022 [Riccia sorocarpa]|uniref:Uncharacterized protein n=1 Tax=Riccia sorocarpa TaxID=122646 RepID=A0ABD3GKD1_9MARC